MLHCYAKNTHCSITMLSHGAAECSYTVKIQTTHKVIQKQVLNGHARAKSTIKNHFCLNTDHSHKNRTLFEVVSLQYTSPPVFKLTRTRSSITEIFQYQNGDINIYWSLMTVKSPYIPSTRSQHKKKLQYIHRALRRLPDALWNGQSAIGFPLSCLSFCLAASWLRRSPAFSWATFRRLRWLSSHSAGITACHSALSSPRKRSSGRRGSLPNIR